MSRKSSKMAGLSLSLSLSQMEQFRTHFKEANKTSQVSVEPTRTTKGRETKEYMVQSTEIRPEENWQNL